MPRRALTLAVLSLVVLSTSGCASLWRGTARAHNLAPSGLPWGEDLLRRALVLGSFDQALVQTAPKANGAPSDALLQSLFRGQVAYYAGQWEESARAFAVADRLTEQRYTKSVSRGALSMITNDRALLFVPARTERLFARYYAMMGRLQANDVQGASVEARRLSALLEETAHEVEPDERATHAALRDVAGAVFEVAGEWNDAGVAFRNAALLRGASLASLDSIASRRPAGDSATLVMVLESGFVAHYVARTIAIPMDDASLPLVSRVAPPSAFNRFVSSELRERIAGTEAAADATRSGRMSPVEVDEALTAHGDPVTTHGPASVGTLAPSAASLGDSLRPRRRLSTSARWLAALDALPQGGVFDEPFTPASDEATGASAVSDDWTPRAGRGTAYLGDRFRHRNWMEISWPTLVRSRLPSAAVQLSLSGLLPDDDRTPWSRTQPSTALSGTVALISDAVGADARRLRGARLARLTARTVSRMAVVGAVQEKHGAAAGMLAGMLVSAIERADTRAWHLLPGQLTVLRVTVPAGELTPALLHGNDANALRHALPTRRVAPGSVHVVTTRLWRDPAGGAVAPRVAELGRQSSPAP